MSLIARHTIRRIVCVLRSNKRGYSEIPDKDKPVKFTTSEAAGWRAEFTRSGNIYDDSPDAQPFIVSLSTGFFLWYFLYYREESDIDEKFDIFNDNIYNKVDGLEEVQLKMAREKKLRQGESVLDIEQRLQDLEREKTEKQP